MQAGEAETLRHTVKAQHRCIGTLDLSLQPPESHYTTIYENRPCIRALGMSAHPRAAGRREVGRDELGVEDVDLRVMLGFGLG